MSNPKVYHEKITRAMNDYQNVDPVIKEEEKESEEKESEEKEFEEKEFEEKESEEKQEDL